jgi:hypothetical protein
LGTNRFRFIFLHHRAATANEEVTPMRLRRISAACCAAAVALAACDRASSPDSSAPSVSFHYAGARLGTFRVTAPRPAQPLPAPVVDATTPGYDGFFLSARTAAHDEHEDQVFIAGVQTPGSYDVENCGAVTSVCVEIEGSFGASSSQPFIKGETEGQVNWRLTRGTLTLLPPDRDGWIHGTFSGTGSAAVYTNGNWQERGTITIEYGRFASDVVFRKMCC